MTRYIKRKLDLDRHLQEVWLRGEISNFKHHSRGHMYMTIKDQETRIQAVMFAGNNRSLKFYPENGMNVLIRGNVSVYEASGQYQLYIYEMEPDGIGALYLAYEQLKNKLEQRGYFSAERKKPIPLFPKRIGVITSPTGAAVRDIITTIHRRFPLVEVVVIPVQVQGASAAVSIRNGIETANRIGGFDTLIVGRGGGSIEELWSFNEENVADAIFNSRIPVISAVGHETDTTISDFVADLRAPTPTGAAELAVPSKDELKQTTLQLTQRMNIEMKRLIETETKHIQNLTNSYAFRYPKELLRQKEQQLDQRIEVLGRTFQNGIQNKTLIFESLLRRLNMQHPKEQVTQAAKKLFELKDKNERYMKRIVDGNNRELRSLIDKLSLVNPLEIMKRGFALPYNQEGELIKSVGQVREKDTISIKLTDGKIKAEVLKIKENPDDEEI